MKNSFKLVVVVFIAMIVLTLSGCDFFSAVGRSMANVAITIKNGGNINDTTSKVTMDVYAFLYAVDNDGNYKETNYLGRIAKRRIELNDGQDVDLQFNESIRTGTKIKVVVYLKTTGLDVDNKNYKGETEIHVITEGKNVPDFKAFEETTETAFQVWY